MKLSSEEASHMMERYVRIDSSVRLLLAFAFVLQCSMEKKNRGDQSRGEKSAHMGTGTTDREREGNEAVLLPDVVSSLFPTAHTQTSFVQCALKVSGELRE